MQRTARHDQAGHVVVYVLLGLVVVAALALGIWRIQSNNKKTPAKTPATTQSPTAKARGSQTSKPLTSGIDDASLAKDIANLGGSVDEGTKNLQSATTATNDESHVVDVPTN